MELLCPYVQLTAHESRIAQMLLEGKSGPEMAVIMGTGSSAVKNTLQRIYRKCGIDGGTKRVKLVVLLHQNVEGAA